MNQGNNGKRIKLHFDGKRLNATENGRYAGGWDGVSGEKGLQEPQWQEIIDRGPIPEGVYDVDQLQYPPPAGSWERFKGRINRGTWKGLENAWGNSRAFLNATSTTHPKAAHRSGFSIHGGTDPGSAGCIDLTNGMDRFADFYRKTGQSAELNVSYPEYDSDDFTFEALERKYAPAAAPEADNRWDPDGARNRRSFSLRDALRIFE
ncbi:MULTISPECIES: L,D-transpeptidase family protein [unclassified Ensifer]|uniref:L,D-transpeptidase family protein n=1 Tax=unclassified Ensifer TaxID=2633371 RepID=UPI0008131277|nr:MULTISPECIES: L,D-transpeptidase family protein [unclassified Ensifer]OCP23163.1 hypothetical protein BC361_23380 [Ensifer sp. LC54]OCP24991.1 hypothetical protein BC363_21560 [Ensifer sp. LC384]OCP38623.1 hypothetical protein BC360_00685 [Ensifer sp. LC163]